MGWTCIDYFPVGIQYRNTVCRVLNERPEEILPGMKRLLRPLVFSDIGDKNGQAVYISLCIKGWVDGVIEYITFSYSLI